MTLRSLGLTVGGTFGVFVLGALLMNFVVMPLLVHQRNSVIVPDLRSMSEQQARQQVKRMSLEIRIERSQFDQEIPAGYVISHRPRVNDTIKEGRTISVVMSLGPKQQRVPDLNNLSLRQSQLMLSRQSLSAGRVARVLEEGGSKERETVIAFAPSAGQEIEEGSRVDMLVAVGGRPKAYLMPDLEGQDLLFIREKLEGHGFRVGGIRYEKRGDAFPNTIIGQSPKPGTMIREGDSIELVAAGTE